MPKTTLKAILTGSDDLAKMKHCVYIVRKGNEVLYIGKVDAASNNLQRRFQMHIGESGPKIQSTPLGIEISNNAPASDNWSVEVLTIAECNQRLHELAYEQRVLKINTAERAMIKHYHPRINVQSNLPSQTVPWQRKPISAEERTRQAHPWLYAPSWQTKPSADDTN